MKPYINASELAFLINLKDLQPGSATFLICPGSLLTFKDNFEFINQRFRDFDLSVVNVHLNHPHSDKVSRNARGERFLPAFLHDVGFVNERVKKCEKLLRIVGKNYEENERGFPDMELQELDQNIVALGIEIVVQATENTSGKVKRYLETYLQDYELEKLYMPNQNMVRQKTSFQQISECNCFGIYFAREKTCHH